MLWLICDLCYMASDSIKPPWLRKPFLDEFLAHYARSFDIKKSAMAAAKKEKIALSQLDDRALFEIQNDDYVCRQLRSRAKVVREQNFNHTKERVEMELVRRSYDFDVTNLFYFAERDVNKYDSHGNLMETVTMKVLELTNPEDWSDLDKKMIKGVTQTKDGIKLSFKDDTKYLELLGKAYGLFDKAVNDEDNGEPVTFTIKVADGRRSQVNPSAGMS